MSHDENFSGDRLRLASFLRVVDKMPQQRPARFQRRVRALDAERHTEAFTVQPRNPRNNASHPGLDTHEPPDAGLPADFTPGSPSRITAQILAETAMAAGGATHQDNYRKGKVVYRSTADNTDPRSPGDISTRRRQLPVNELALVRTSTVDGLPEPSGTEDRSSSPPSIPADPIQDSQSGGPIASISNYRHVKTAPTRTSVRGARQKMSTRKYSRTSNGGSIRRERGQEFRLIDQPRTCQRQQSSFERVADGFIGSEFILTSRPKNPFTTPHTRKQKATPRPSRESTLKTQGLILTIGYLPDQPVHSIVSLCISTPTALGAAVQYDLSSIPLGIEFDCTLPLDAFAVSQTRAPGEDQPAMCGQQPNTSPTSSHSAGEQNLNQTMSHMSKRPTDAEVLNQLSSIKAPVRAESSSEEDDEEEPDNGFSTANDENSDTDSW